MVGVWRGLSAILARPRSQKDRTAIPQGASEGWLTAVVVIVVIGLCVGAGIFPQTLSPLAVRLTETCTFFVP